LLLQEPMSGLQIMGGALLLAGIYFSKRGS
jgi:drug/metabolite transporter (DMT)-like permease